MANPPSTSESEISERKSDAWRGQRIDARIKRGLTIAAALLLVVPLLAFAIDRARHRHEVLSGVSVGGTSLSGLARRDAEASVRKLGERLAARPIAVRIGARTFEIMPSALDFALDVENTVTDALAAGRNRGLIAGFGFWVARLFSQQDIAPRARIDADKAHALLEGWERELGDQRPFAGEIAVVNGRASARPPRGGKLVDRPRAIAGLQRVLATPLSAGERAAHPPAPFDLPLVEREPFAVPGALDAALARANRVLAGPVTLRAESPSATLALEVEELARALRTRPPTPEKPEMQLYLDPQLIEDELRALRSEVERQPENARFVIGPGDRIGIVPGKNGTLLSTERVAQALLEAATAPGRSGTLPILVGAEPEIKTSDLEALRVTKLVSQYTTHHACCQPRVENIHRIADLLDGKVVKPGEIISINAEVGTRTPKNGFKAAPTIEEGEMVDALGGGVSQFATTIFNAIFLGGYDVIERVPHTFYFSRYPMGRDATLSWPKPDIIFKNDTDAGMLIDTVYTDTSITVKIYGDNGGRKVSFEVSPQQNVERPTTEYIPDMTQTHEKDKIKEPGQLGWTVFVTRKIRFSDGTNKEEKRKVVYKARVRRLVVHPCRVPEGEAGHTGVKCPEPESEEEEAKVEGER